MQNALDANLYMRLSYSLKLDYEINGIHSLPLNK